MTSYWLGIDLGTTYTAAAICWPAVDGLEVQVVPLSNHSHAVPSVLYLPGDGSVVVGEGAQRRALTDPDRVIREFKSRIGDEIPMLVGGSPFFAHDLAAEFASWLWNLVSEREGQHPEGVTLTCPASWGPYKTALFERAVQDAGLNHVTLLGEPQAAAISYASRERVEVGATLAVYDLGGGTFDAAVVRKDSPTSFTVLGRPEGIDGLGGVNFDEAIFEHVCAAAGVPLEQLNPNDPHLVADVARLRRECTEAKEALSVDTDATIAVSLGGVRQRVRLTRAEFEEMIRPDLDRTIEAMHRALESASVDPAQLDAILLVGGSSRIPLVSQLISAEFGRAPAIDEDPKVAVAMGAARFSAPADEESAPATGTLEAPVQFPADEAPPERPEMASMLDGDEEGEDSLVAPGRKRSRKALLGAAALVLLVLAGGITALRTPMLSNLLSHHTTHGTAASSGASGAPSGSAGPSGKAKAKPSGTASGTAQAGSSTGPSASTSSKAKGTKTTTKTKATPKPTPGSGGGGTGGGPIHTQTTPAAPPPTTVPPTTPPPPTTDPPTTPPATSGTTSTS
ncbi:MAG TPA: Hsp70 family protein [Streptosporangiaceae bacterium]|nr:Hsp70 family protein [Streptosporangiaceae bacterium]